MQLYSRQLKTPVGAMTAWAGDDGLYLFDFEYRTMLPQIQQRVLTYFKATVSEGDHPVFGLLETQLADYFTGSLQAFNLPLQLAGSPFQIGVWKGLMDIPFGKVRTYKQQSVLHGDEKAIRAVASANGANGIAIIVPCHRVVGTNGSLTGYGGGLHRKKWLLDHEQRHSSAVFQQDLFT